MTKAAMRIPRELAVRYGREALAIAKAGSYTSPSGKTVDIAPLVAAAVAGTVSYPPTAAVPLQRHGPYATAITVRNETTLAAGSRLLGEGYRPVALNFASATHPGGGFLSGARAQEEYLAWSSGLYTCLVSNPMYAFHRQQNDPLYTDYAIYSPDVPVFRADDGTLLEAPYTMSIITGAAPNAGKLRDIAPDRLSKVPAVFRSRIQRVLSLGLLHAHDAIVLGAWGCGAFGNDADMVAGLFRGVTEQDVAGAYRHITFAILDWSDDHRFVGPFERVFVSSSEVRGHDKYGSEG